MTVDVGRQGDLRVAQHLLDGMKVAGLGQSQGHWRGGLSRFKSVIDDTGSRSQGAGVNQERRLG